MDYYISVEILGYSSQLNSDYHIEPFKYDEKYMEEFLKNNHIEYKEYTDNYDEHEEA